MPLPKSEPDQHFKVVAQAVLEGRLVPFLGAGANLCDRPEKFQWNAEQSEFLPSGAEVAAHLAKKFLYPRTGADLLRISQYGDISQGTGRLYQELDLVFQKRYPTTSIHQFLASLPAPAPQARRPDDRWPLIATTNYDDLIELGYQEAHRKCDLVFYVPEGAQRGRFWHQEPDKLPVPIEVDKANSYGYRFFEKRPVVLKIHGTINLTDENLEGFVITEDHYIDYLAEEPLEKLLPPALVAKLRKNHLLFLGYSLSDWNFRVFLRRMKRPPREKFTSWAVMLSSDPEEEAYWSAQGIRLRNQRLVDYVLALKQALEHGDGQT